MKEISINIDLPKDLVRNCSSDIRLSYQFEISQNESAVTILHF